MCMVASLIDCLKQGMSKAATHHLALSTKEDLELRKGCKLVCMLPSVIDTEANREAMPGADFNTWTSPNDIATKVEQWCTNQASRPPDLFVPV